MVRFPTIRQLIMCLVVATLLSPAMPAVAASTYISGDVEFNFTYYSTRRHVTYSPWEIAVMRTGGNTDQLGMFYYGCGSSAGAGAGGTRPVYYGGWTWLRTGKTHPIEFCLAAAANETGNFTALLDWDGIP